MKKTISLLLALLCAVSALCLGACGEKEEPDNTTEILLNGTSAEVKGKGAGVSGSTVTITEGGNYTVSGKLDDGQLVVALAEKEKVVLTLKGADITCMTSAAIYVKACKKCEIVLADGTDNILTDGAAYQYENALDSEPSACVFSKDDLKISGSGSLTVNANFNNGIASKDSLTVENGNITVTAVNNGIKGKDDVTIEGGKITVTCGGDAIKSDKANDLSLGFVEIKGGELNLKAEDEGIQAETNVLISDGAKIVIASDSNGIKATYSVQISAGSTVEITAAKEGILGQTVTGTFIFNGKTFRY